MNGAQDGVHSRVLERRCDVHNSQAIKHEGEGMGGGGGGGLGGELGGVRTAHVGLPVLINLLLV